MQLLYKPIAQNLTLELENVFSLVTRMVPRVTFFMTYIPMIFLSHEMLFFMRIISLLKIPQLL
jgi:hypothetical protein